MTHRRISASSAQPVVLMKEDPDGMLSPVLDPTPIGSIGGTPSAGGLTNLELRALPVPVSGTVTVANPTAGPPAVQPVSDNGGSLTVDGTVGISGIVPVSGPLTDAQLRANAVPVAGTVAVSNMAAQGLTDAQLRAAAVPVSGTVNTTPTDSEQRPRCADLSVSLSTAAAAGGTLTLPAPPVGQRHHITNIDITLYSAAARTGAAAPVAITSTNLPSAQAWVMATAGAIGTVDRLILNYPAPLRSVVAAVATTFVFPVVTGGLWRVNVTYYVAA